MRKFTRLIMLSMIMLLSSMLMFAQTMQITDIGSSGMDKGTAAAMLQNADVDPSGKVRNVSSNRAVWDIQYSFDVETPTGLNNLTGAESDGEFIYATVWNNNQIVKFDVDGNYIETFTIAGVSNLRDLAFDGTYMYGAAATATVFKMDFTAQTLVSTFTAPTPVRAIAYDSDDNAFWGNNWDSDLVKFNESGANLGVISGPPSMYGAAYDNFSAGGPFLWIFTGTNTASSVCQLEQMDIATGTLTGVVHSVSDDFGASIAGGVYITEGLVSGTRTLGGTAQGTLDIAFGYEIGETSPPVPISNWAIVLGIFLIAAFMVLRFRRKLA